MRVLPAGDRALLAEYDSLEETMAAFRGLELTRPDAVIDLVPAARTVLVRVDARRWPLASAREWITSTAPVSGAETASATVEIPVRYDGEDLDALAALLSLRTSELIARHCAAEWTSAFIGFAPGFAYLSSPDFDFDIPRRATSRPVVPAGSVALAGGFSGVYPRASPGGWQLIGTTDARLWDPGAAPPALLPPGTRVRFVAL